MYYTNIKNSKKTSSLGAWIRESGNRVPAELACRRQPEAQPSRIPAARQG
jgi:hypothetical protein